MLVSAIEVLKPAKPFAHALGQPRAGRWRPAGGSLRARSKSKFEYPLTSGMSASSPIGHSSRNDASGDAANGGDRGVPRRHPHHYAIGQPQWLALIEELPGTSPAVQVF